MSNERPYRLALLGTSPAAAGEADLPLLKASPVATGEGDHAQRGGRGALGEMGFSLSAMRMSNERPYRLALLGTSPALAGKADLPFLKASPVGTGEVANGVSRWGRFERFAVTSLCHILRNQLCWKI